MNLLEFAGQLTMLVLETEEADKLILEQAAKIVEREAKREIGHYQSAAGPFVAWAELAESTKADRLNKGYSENDPLLRSGDLRNSIEHTVSGREAHIGSNDPIAEYQELGTNRIPPRSFLGGAAFRKEKEIVELIGVETTSFLSGSGVVGGRLAIK